MLLIYVLYIKWASHVVLVVKNPPANERRIRYLGLIPGSGRFSGGEVMATHSIILAWRIQSEEPAGLQSKGPQRVR